MEPIRAWKGHGLRLDDSRLIACPYNMPLMSRLPDPPRRCKQCGEPVQRYRSKKGRLLMPVVCLACRERWRHPSGKDHWHWKGGERSSKDGYVRVWVAPGQRTLEHRAIWEAAYGPIPPGMHIHHRNGDKTDNRLDNLVLASNSEHQHLHVERKLGDRWSLTHKRCIACRTTERPHRARGLCGQCYGRLHEAGLV